MKRSLKKLILLAQVMSQKRLDQSGVNFRSIFRTNVVIVPTLIMVKFLFKLIFLPHLWRKVIYYAIRGEISCSPIIHTIFFASKTSKLHVF